MHEVAENLSVIRDDIARLSRACGRIPDSVRLVAVSKMQPDERVNAALAAGQRLFGENRVQEARARWTERRVLYPDITLHLIGPLQTNKVKDAVALFDCIETVDRTALAEALVTEMEKQGRALPCLIQVNTGAEEQKAGVAPDEVSSLLAYCRDIGLDVRGLMAIPPVDDPPALHFALLRKLARENNLQELSMGMSADYPKAIPLDATYVRVGSAIFGERIET